MDNVTFQFNKQRHVLVFKVNILQVDEPIGQPWSWISTLFYGVFFYNMFSGFNRNPYNGYINPYYWPDDHPLLYGNNGSLGLGTHKFTPEV